MQHFVGWFEDDRVSMDVEVTSNQHFEKRSKSGRLRRARPYGPSMSVIPQLLLVPPQKHQHFLVDTQSKFWFATMQLRCFRSPHGAIVFF